MPEELMVGLCIIPLVAIPFVFFAFVRYMRYRETLVLAEKGLVSPASHSNGRDTLRWGIVITALGLALMCGLYPVGFFMRDSGLPLFFGPWMLIGLIPTALGLALILIYRVTRDENGNGKGGNSSSGGAAASPAAVGGAASPVPPGWGAEPDSADLGAEPGSQTPLD
jgi:hypothetical protein